MTESLTVSSVLNQVSALAGSGEKKGRQVNAGYASIVYEIMTPGGTFKENT